MPTNSYGLFCPLAMACEAIEPKWTLLILSEMWSGATRFNEIRRGVPGLSATLLSKRLRELEKQDLIERVEDSAKGSVDYIRTPRAIELEPAMTLLADWAFRNIEADVALDGLNQDYLMWNIRRKINIAELPERRVVVRFHFNDVKESTATYWLIARPGTAVDLCMSDPGFDVDLFVEADSKALASVWLGYSTLHDEECRGRIFLSGDLLLIKSIDRWMVKMDWSAEAAE